MRALASSIRQGLRALLRSPAFLLTSTLVLGASLGNQIAVSSVVDALLFSPPTAVRPGELAFIGTTVTNGQVSRPDFLDLDERNRSFSGLFGYSTYRSAGVVANDTFLVTSCTAVSGNFFPTLGMPAAQGRLFTDEDDHVAAAPVVVLTAEMQVRLNVRVGEMIKINNEPFAVVGILPADFRAIERGPVAGVWLPLSKITPFRLAPFLTNRGFQWVRLGGRLQPGTTLDAANAELKVLAAALRDENKRDNAGMELFARKYTASRLAEGGNTRTVLLLYGIAWLLSGLAFVNFAALTMLRLLARRRELSIRMSIGATRADISWPLLVELMAVCAIAVAAGLGFAMGLMVLFQQDPGLAAAISAGGTGISGRAVATVLVAVVACGLIVWALAMRYACQPNLSAAARETLTTPHRQRVSLVLYAVQFAIVLCLVVIAIAIVGELRAIERRALPFRTEQVLLAEVNTSVLGLASNRDAKEKFFDTVLQEIRRTPGVLAAGANRNAPLTPAGSTTLILNGEDPADIPDRNFSHYSPTMSGYFEAIGVRVLAGRTFTDADMTRSARVAVINRAAARRFWPQGAVGQTFKPWAGNLTLQVVGVVDDIPLSTAAETPPQIFLPYCLVGNGSALTFAIHVQEDSTRVRSPLEDGFKAIWPGVGVPTLTSMAEQVALSRVDVKLAVRVALMIAGIAALVIGFGLYFFSAYSAAQSLRQSAVRLALGASPGRVMAEHLLNYRWALVVGTALGLAFLWTARSLSDLVPLASGPDAARSSLLAVVIVTGIALIGLCLPLRSLYRLSVYRVLSRSD